MKRSEESNLSDRAAELRVCSCRASNLQSRRSRPWWTTTTAVIARSQLIVV
jgi:hypothetical protein